MQLERNCVYKRKLHTPIKGAKNKEKNHKPSAQPHGGHIFRIQFDCRAFASTFATTSTPSSFFKNFFVRFSSLEPFLSVCAVPPLRHAFAVAFVKVFSKFLQHFRCSKSWLSRPFYVRFSRCGNVTFPRENKLSNLIFSPFHKAVHWTFLLLIKF